jgi:GGDEF domain-containing protein
LITVTLLGVVDLFLKHPLGFSGSGYAPYVLLLLLLGAFRGYWAAGVGLLYASPMVVVLLPVVDGRFDLPAGEAAFLNGSVEAALLLFLSLVTVLVVITVMHRKAQEIDHQAARLLEARENELRQNRENQTLMDAIIQLRDRFAVDSSSITTLYHQIPHLYAQQLPDVYRGLLQSVQVMTKAARVGIFEFVEEELSLLCRDFVTESEATAPPARLDLSTSIEGWVVRREQLFSMKRLLNDPELRSIDDGRAVLCGPIRSGRRLWGVVTVEEMPFTAYNEYTEKAFELILALAGPAIENAVPQLFAELADADRPGETLHGYEEFADFLHRELESASSTGVDVSLMLIEIANLEELAPSDRQKAVGRQLVEQLAQTVSDITGGVSALFRFKSENQLAVLLPSRHASDFGYVSRQVVEAVSARAWNADGEAVFPEILIGSAQASESEYAVQPLVGHAERLLQRQLRQYRQVRNG